MRHLRGLVAAAIVLGLAASAPISQARFTDADAGTAAFTSGSILPPTSLAGTNGTIATLTWVPSTSTVVTGYEVYRSATSGSGFAQVGSVAPRTATTTTDDPAAGTWYYVLRSTWQGWTSVASNEASVLVGLAVTGFVGCASTAADTGGDGDGYESGPGSACALDAAFAQDVNTGTSTVDSCTDPGKDRHRFWGYALGLPGSVTSIDGIELQLVAGLNNNGGTTRICAELSWDGGTTWTGAKSVPLTSNGLATYVLGAAGDTWGHAWTAAELDPANLRLRLVDVSTHANKTIRLDGAMIQVTYTP
jgi:hypothetical protein